jgi:hypothetical protein
MVILQKLEHKHLDKAERIGEYKEWYDNGQLAEKHQLIYRLTKEMGNGLNFTRMEV